MVAGVISFLVPQYFLFLCSSLCRSGASQLLQSHCFLHACRKGPWNPQILILPWRFRSPCSREFITGISSHFSGTASKEERTSSSTSSCTTELSRTTCSVSCDLIPWRGRRSSRADDPSHAVQDLSPENGA